VWPRGWVEVWLYSFMTAALEGGEWSAACPSRTLLPGKSRYPFYRRLGEPQGRSGRAESLVPTGIRSRTVQPVVQSLYRLSYPAHTFINLNSIIFQRSEVFIHTAVRNSTIVNITGWWLDWSCLYAGWEEGVVGGWMWCEWNSINWDMIV